MDVLLVSPDYGVKERSFPWGILSLGSYFSNLKKYDFELLDAGLYPPPEFYNKLGHLAKKTILIGISMMSTDAYFTKKVADYVKSVNPSVKVIIGGSHAMLEPEQTCSYKNIDFVAYGEGELTLSLLIDNIKEGRDSYETIPGLVYKKDGRIKKTNPPNPVGFYDINYSLFPEICRSKFSDYIQVLTGRGCSFKCTFCFNSVCAQKWRGRAMEDVVGEIERIVAKYNPRVIYFRDENFFHSPERIKEFIRYYRQKNFKFKWRANCRASYFNENYMTSDLLKDIEDINCQVLKFGLESGSQRVLDYLKKGTNIDSVHRLIYTFKKITRIVPSYSFMIGIPTETPVEYKQTLSLIRFIRKHNPNAKIIGPQYFRIYPGGELYEEIVKKYNYSKPGSFEEWSEMYLPGSDFQGFSKNINHPWVKPKYLFFAQHVDTIVLFCQQDIRKYFKIKLFWHLPFILLSKIRIKFGWFGALYEVRLAVFLRALKAKLS